MLLTPNGLLLHINYEYELSYKVKTIILLQEVIF